MQAPALPLGHVSEPSHYYFKDKPSCQIPITFDFKNVCVNIVLHAVRLQTRLAALYFTHGSRTEQNKENQMKKYELLATLKPNLDIDEADKVVARVEELVTGFGGSILDTEKMGRKKLAYDVQGFRDGFMFVQKLTVPADKITEFKRQLKLNENIIRTMFVEIKKAKSPC